MEAGRHLFAVTRILGTESSVQRRRDFRGLWVTILRNGSQRPDNWRNEDDSLREAASAELSDEVAGVW